MFDAAHRTKEMCETLDWVRAYNKSAVRKIVIAGVDMQSYWASIDFLRHTLLEKDIRDSVDLMYLLQAKAKNYQDFEKLIQLAGDCAANFNIWLNNSGTEMRGSQRNLLIQHALVQLVSAYRKKLLLFKSMSLSVSAGEDSNFRDSVMASNVIWLHEKYLRGRKMIIIAHNEHITKAKNILGADAEYKNIRSMGKHLDNTYHEKYRTFALFTGNGHVTGFDKSGIPSVYPLESPYIDSYEYYYNKSSFPNFYLSLRQKVISAEVMKLFRNLQWRSLGFDGGSNGFQFKFYNLIGNFDGIFFVRNSSSSVSTIPTN